MNEIADCENVDCLVLSLASKDLKRRVSARLALVAMGKPATEPLIRALSDRRTRMRWEAAKALTGIPDPAAAPALAACLTDNDFGVRWLAAEALTRLGGEALAPVLKTIMGNPRSREVREGAHHIIRNLRDLAPGLLRPVLDALEDYDWDQVASAAAETALKALKGVRRSSARVLQHCYSAAPVHPPSSSGGAGVPSVKVHAGRDYSLLLRFPRAYTVRNLPDALAAIRLAER